MPPGTLPGPGGITNVYTEMCYVVRVNPIV